MKKLERILENEFRMIVFLNKINIVNYKEIIDLKDNLIVIKTEKIIEIKGENLILNKMLNNELLVTGTIKKINII